MSKDPHKCTAGCGRVITYRFAICSVCEKEHGRSALGWPTWLRESWNMTQRERRQHKRIVTNEIEAGLDDEVVTVG